MRAITNISNASLQAQQIRNIAALQRNLLHLGFVERIADRASTRFKDRNFTSNRNALID